MNHQLPWEGGKAVGGRSQDIGLAVLVTAVKMGCVFCPPVQSANFSVKEKDEASLSNSFRQDSLDAFILRFAGV